MLTDYYDRCREIIDRYGGVTDKFIGDAVMGVFGADAAHEDDAERATRTALELVDMVQGLGGDVGMPGLDARAGVMSGEASVGSGGNEHGLVVGDLVNTASRLQSIAPPGGVYVGESTRDLVGTTVEFTAVGEQKVKGKELSVIAFNAVRVVALSQSKRGGELVEGPFVGRDDELRLLKDQLHATGREQRARMVSIIGEGGIGKTRLSQELLRYIDGIAEVVYYHNGRSPAYGEGVTLWALGEMIRQRAGITEGEDSAKARMKLRTMVAEFAPNEEDQKWIEPRLAALIGIAEMPPGDRSELYAALRTFFQRISERGTVLMVFEDLQWADEGLLGFIEELVERSTQSPILLLALARPELLEKRSDWGATRRRSLLMHLSRLDEGAMKELVAGLAPGMPEGVMDRIAERTAGVPLHAVEFVRMLINSGRMVDVDNGYQLVGDPGELAIPDSVSAIIGARLDRLGPDEVAVIQDASVLGLSFTLGGIADMAEATPEELEDTLRSLVRIDILELDEDPRSPERGQYRFVQSLIREVAYGRLPKSDRVKRHLEVARRTELLDDPELAGVVASHYASAAAADPENKDLMDRARGSIIASAERARALRSDLQAVSLYQHAIELTSDEAEIAELKMELSTCLEKSGREDLAYEIGFEALEYYREMSDSQGIASAATCVAYALAGNFEAARAVEIILPVYETTPQTGDETWARLASQTSRALALTVQGTKAIEIADRVLPVLEQLDMVEELLDTLNNKAMALAQDGRLVESVALFRGIADVARERGLLNAEIRAVNNLWATAQVDNQVQDFGELDKIIDKSGSINWQVRKDFFGSLNTFDTGDIENALSMVEDGEGFDLSEFWESAFECNRFWFEQTRDGVDPIKHARILEIAEGYLENDDPQINESGEEIRAKAMFLHGDFESVVRLVLEGESEPFNYPSSLEEGIGSAGLTGDVESARQLLSRLQAMNLKGRAINGLDQFANMVVSALAGDVESALVARGRMLDFWSTTIPPLTRAHADAVTAAVLPFDHPEAVEAAGKAMDFFTSNGFKAYLDLYKDIFDRYREESEEVAV
jgi:tetratricopeptide (TPR) repeat protein